MGRLLFDIRYALRSLGRTPVFTTIAVITLALGMGANTAIFSLVDATILRPLPFRDPGRLIAVWDTYLPQYPKLGVSPVEVEAWDRQSDIFEQTAWYRSVPQNLTLSATGAEPVEVHAAPVSATLFPLLGVRPALGRAFSEREDSHSALLSYGVWQSRLYGNRAVIGRPVRLNDEQFVIIGVMPPRFRFPEWADIWLPPAQAGDELTNPVRHAAGFIARLRPPHNKADAFARLDAIAQRLAAEHPKTSRGFSLRVSALQEDLTAGVRPALLLLFGAVGLVLLIACGNVANLLLARATARTKEMAVRRALGAGTWALVRQLLIESVVLAGLGALLGLGLAAWIVRTAAPEPAALDSTVLLYAAAAAAICGIVFGLAPAVQVSRREVNAPIKSGAPAGGGSAGMRSTLVVMELALAAVLVTGAGILAKSFLRLMQVGPGFDTSNLLTLRISAPPSIKPADLFRRIDDRVRSLPGVEAIASANTLPLIADRATASRFNVPGSPLINPDALPAAQLRIVSPGYFQAMRIPLRSGRVFIDRDLDQPVVIINESMARRFWPGRDPVGLKFITSPWGPNPTWSTIAGVVGDVKQFGLDSEATMDVYYPALVPKHLVVRTAGDPGIIAASVRREIHAADPDLAISEMRTMDEVVAASARSRRWTMALLGAFAGLALTLALVGVYGVMSWSVAQRTREIGIRVALGAQTSQVRGLMLLYALKLTAAGLVAGLAGAFALRRVLASEVFGVSATDPLIYAGTALLLAASALLACYVPARQATRVDPVIALRWE